MSGKIFKEDLKEKVRITARCEKCNKEITSDSRAGSFTTFLFGANRCSCSEPAQLKLVATATSAQPASAQMSESAITSDKPDLGERYEVLDLIGQGGMGAVWKVRDTAINKTLAIKVLRKELAHDRLAVKRFEQEAQAAACLTQANLVAVYGSGTAKDNSPFLIMDYLEGESLADRLQREVYLPVPQVLDITSQICEALAHAHAKGIVHRDLKPSNIMLTKSADGNDIVKIVDFGIAKLMPSINEQTNNLTQTGDLFGSPLYMSPEQCKGEIVDARADIYSLGCIMYEMLTGRAAFADGNPIKIILKHLNESPQQMDPNLPIGINDLIQRCLAKDPAYRYQTVRQIQQDLELIESGKVLKGVETERPGQLTSKNGWRRIAAELVDAIIVGCISGLICLLAPLFLSGNAIGYMSGECYSAGFILGLLDSLTSFINPLFLIAFFFLSPYRSAQTLTAVLLVLLLFLFNWLYHAILESSKLQGTVGFKLFGLEVSDKSGQPISFAKASQRHFSKLGCFLGITELAGLPIYAALRHTKKIWTPSLLDIFARRTLQDRLSGTFVGFKAGAVPKPQTRLLTISTLVLLLSLSLPSFLQIYDTRPIQFTTASWQNSPDKRYRMMSDLEERHHVIGKSRAELYALLGPPDGMDSKDRVGWSGTTDRNNADGSWEVFTLKNDRVVEISGGLLYVSKYRAPSETQK
jgi:serine/threonine protein kinase